MSALTSPVGLGLLNAGSDLGRGVLGLAGEAINAPIRGAVALGLQGKADAINAERRGGIQSTFDRQNVLNQQATDAQRALNARQAAAFEGRSLVTGLNRSFGANYGYDPATGVDPNSRDVRSAVGRSNRLDDFQAASLAGVDTDTQASLDTLDANTERTLSDLNFQVGGQLEGVAGSENMAMQQALQELEGVARTFGKNSPQYIQAKNQLDAVRVERIGARQRELRIAKNQLVTDINQTRTKLATDITSLRTSLKGQMATAFGSQKLEAGQQIADEQGLYQQLRSSAAGMDENIRQAYEQVDRSIEANYWQGLQMNENWRNQMTTAAGEFEMMGQMEIANAFLGMQINTGAFAGFVDVGTGFVEGYSQGRQLKPPSPPGTDPLMGGLVAANTVASFL